MPNKLERGWRPPEVILGGQNPRDTLKEQPT